MHAWQWQPANFNFLGSFRQQVRTVGKGTVEEQADRIRQVIRCRAKPGTIANPATSIFDTLQVFVGLGTCLVYCIYLLVYYMAISIWYI
jgi:hypothetical protein